MDNQRGGVHSVQLWRLRRARLQHPGYPCVPLMAWGWSASSVPGSRTAAGGMQAWLGWIPPAPDLVVALCQGPCHPLCRNGAREPESSSCGGRGAEGTCCAHGSSQGFSQGTKRCVWWVHVRGPKGCWELLSRVISWQCPRSEDVTAPGRVGEGETPWCNPAGPLALGWATWDEQGLEKLTQTMLEGRAS